MAAFDTTRPVNPSAGRFSTFISTAFGTFAAWNDARMTRNALSQLSAHELEDIGLAPGDIDAISRRTQR